MAFLLARFAKRKEKVKRGRDAQTSKITINKCDGFVSLFYGVLLFGRGGRSDAIKLPVAPCRSVGGILV